MRIRHRSTVARLAHLKARAHKLGMSIIRTREGHFSVTQTGRSGGVTAIDLDRVERYLNTAEPVITVARAIQGVLR